MAFPFFPESHPTMSVENYAYMRQLWQHQRALHNREQNTPERMEEVPSSSAERRSSGCASRRLPRRGSGSESDKRPARLGRIFTRARHQTTTSREERSSSDPDRESDQATGTSTPFSVPSSVTALRPPKLPFLPPSIRWSTCFAHVRASCQTPSPQVSS